MNKILTGPLLIIFLQVLFSCGSKPHIENFNEENWKGDKLGCKGVRAVESAAILSSKMKLQGVAELDLIKTLGKADETIMYKRNVKNLIYYIEPGAQCGGTEKKGTRLIIELNALGFVTWMYEESL